MGDNGINWYSYQVVDDGSPKPKNSTQMRSGQWTDSLTGTYDGWLWGLDTSIAYSKVVFCGDINHLNMGGEVVIADIAHFIDGSPPNARNFFSQYWVPDCALSTNGATVAALGRNMTSTGGNVSFRDVVYGIGANDGSLLWERHVAGPNSTAWAVTWEPGGGSYTIAYNHPSPSQPKRNPGKIFYRFFAFGHLAFRQLLQSAPKSDQIWQTFYFSKSDLRGIASRSFQTPSRHARQTIP